MSHRQRASEEEPVNQQYRDTWVKVREGERERERERERVRERKGGSEKETDM